MKIFCWIWHASWILFSSFMVTNLRDNCCADADCETRGWAAARSGNAAMFSTEHQVCSSVVAILVAPAECQHGGERPARYTRYWQASHSQHSQLRVGCKSLMFTQVQNSLPLPERLFNTSPNQTYCEIDNSQNQKRLVMYYVKMLNFLEAIKRNRWFEAGSAVWVNTSLIRISYGHLNNPLT